MNIFASGWRFLKPEIPYIPGIVGLPSLEARSSGTIGEIKRVFQSHLEHLKPDNNLARHIRIYEQSFANKNNEHVSFLGSALLGVYPIRFTTDDRDMFFDEVLDADEYDIKKDLFDLPCIDPSFKVSSDVFNQSCIYLLHLLYHSKMLSDKAKHDAMVDVVKILHYRFLSSLMAHYFKYPADREVALATYASLSKKYDIKQYGSWRALIEARAKAIIAKTAIHFHTIDRYEDDTAIIYMINDIQGRIRQVVKSMTAEFHSIKDRNARIITTSKVITLDGETRLRDHKSATGEYRRYIHEIISDKPSFIRDELVDVICDAISSLPPKLILSTLDYVSANYGGRDQGISSLLDETLQHAFDFINTREVSTSDLLTLTFRLKAIYTASRTSDPVLLNMRKIADKIIVKAVGNKSPTVMSSIRTGLMLYIVLRTLSMKHYSQG